MRILAIVPARCGSKGIPFKNIVDVCGKPLIQYTIDIAIQLKKDGLLDEVVVSTDCEDILIISQKLGANVPFLRPDNIAGDKAKSLDYIIHSIDYFESIHQHFDTIIILQPTSPMKTYDDIYNSIELFKSHRNNSLISVYKDETINKLIMYHKDGDIAVPLDENHNKGIRRQDHGAVYIRNGAIYITNIDFIKKEQKIVSDNPLLFEMTKTNSINIDSFEELELVRKMVCK